MLRRTLLPLALLAFAAACQRAPSAPDTAPPAEGTAPLPRVTDGRSDLLFSFVDARGDVRAVSRIADVPEGMRERVLVTDLSLTPNQRQAHRYAFFADLTTKAADGSYPVTVVSRYDAARGEGPVPALAPVPAGAVVVYSAEWCGFCKKAKRWLTDAGVPFVERDVERQPGVAKELADKLAVAGVRGGGVPVIDWGGEIVMGFDRPRLERLLRAASGAREAAQ